MSKEPGMERNYFLAIVLSLLVIILSPYFFRTGGQPQDIAQETAVEEKAVPEEAKKLIESAGSLLPVQNDILGGEAEPESIDFENETYRIQFSTLGGSIAKLVYKGEPNGNGVEGTVFYEGNASSTGLFNVKILHEMVDLRNALFHVQSEEAKRDGVMEFVYERPEEYRITKRYFVDEKSPVIGLDIVLKNLSRREKHFPLEFEFAIDCDISDAMEATHYETVVYGDKIHTANVRKVSKKGYTAAQDVTWAGMIKRYYALLANPDWKIIHMKARTEEGLGENQSVLWSTLRMEPVSVKPNQDVKQQIFIYAGPQRYETLKEFHMEFEKILTRGFFGNFKIWILLSLKWIYRYTHNYGWAIILFTLLLKGLFLPLTHQSSKHMKKMQALSPKLKALQEKYKGEPQKLQKEMSGLYKRNKTNPAAGCLPMLIQMPIFIAMFRLLPEAIELKGAPFIWWIQDLSQPDRLFVLPFTIPLLGWDAINLVPIVMTASQFWYQKVMPQPGTSPEQTKIFAFMPLFFGFICYSMPSGLVLYWFMQNLFSIIQQVFINKIVVVLHHEDRE